MKGSIRSLPALKVSQNLYIFIKSLVSLKGLDLRNNSAQVMCIYFLTL